MNRSGCKNCPVKPCETLYRGSICLSRRHKLGLGDPMTNADHIRAMSDEEMAEFIISIPMCVGEDKDLNCEIDVCKECFLKWLQQPAEEDKYEAD